MSYTGRSGHQLTGLTQSPMLQRGSTPTHSPHWCVCRSWWGPQRASSGVPPWGRGSWWGCGFAWRLRLAVAVAAPLPSSWAPHLRPPTPTSSLPPQARNLPPLPSGTRCSRPPLNHAGTATADLPHTRIHSVIHRYSVLLVQPQLTCQCHTQGYIVSSTGTQCCWYSHSWPAHTMLHSDRVIYRYSVLLVTQLTCHTQGYTVSSTGKAHSVLLVKTELICHTMAQCHQEVLSPDISHNGTVSPRGTQSCW